MAVETYIPENLSDLDLEQTKFLVNGVRKLAKTASTGIALDTRMHSIQYEKWLKEQELESAEGTQVELFVPSFYADLTPNEIAAVKDTMEFPAPDREYEEAVHSNVKHWTTSLLMAKVRGRISSHTSDVAIQSRLSHFVYTTPGHLYEHHEAWDSKGRYSPFDGPSVLRSAILAPIIEFGRTLDADVVEDKDQETFLDNLR